MTKCINNYPKPVSHDKIVNEKRIVMKPFIQNSDEHKINLDDLFKRLNSSSQGLATEDAVKRQQKYGFNVLEEKEKKSILSYTDVCAMLFALARLLLLHIKRLTG